MKKVIFEGVVNDVKFDNVEEYNKAIAEAVASGNEFNAYTNTTVVDEPEKEQVANILFPGINDLNFLTKEMFKTNLETEDNYLPSSDDILDVIKHMDEGERDSYKEDLGQVIKYVSDYITQSTNEIEATTQLIDTVAKRCMARLDELRRSKKVIESECSTAHKLLDHYTESMRLLEEVKGETNEEDSDVDEHTQAITKLLSLCESIFPDYKGCFDNK